jgi:hypothetical protein
MPNTFEDVKLTDTTTSYRVDLDYIDLEESLDESYARNLTEFEESSNGKPSPTPAPLNSETE